ncbi:MAG: hypothetical protein ABI459_09225, partial [Deltaproteobacteria bacterium]
GVIFVVLLIAVPVDEDPPTTAQDVTLPRWAKDLGSALLGFAPKVESFADGSRGKSLTKGQQVELAIKPDADHDTRLLSLKLITGGPAQAVFRCFPGPGPKCESRVQILCLGAQNPSDCDDQDMGKSGSFSVGGAGGALTLIAWDEAPARIEIAQ